MAKTRAEVTGISKSEPKALDPAFVGLMIKMGADAVVGIKGGRDLMGGLRAQDLFTIAILNARYERDDYVLTVRFTNLSGHGAYVEALEVRAAQKREGPDAPQPPVRLVRLDESMSFPGREARALPVYVGPMGEKEDIEIRITLVAGTWAARDAFGHLVATVRALDEEADIPRTTTFAIRPRRR